MAQLSTAITLGLLVLATALSAEARPDFSKRRLAFSQDSQDALETLATLTRHYYVGVPMNGFVEDAWAMAEGFARLGLNQSAEDHYRRAAGLGVDQQQQNRAWLALARSLAHRSAWQETLDALDGMAEPLSDEQQDEREFLRAQARMRLGNYSEAALGIKNWKSPNRRDDYTRYNMGVALIKLGDLKQGTGMLEQVGTLREQSPEMLALRDKANVALGFSFLKAEQGATAKPVFQRVRLDGPLSEKALLGAGWAELVPPGVPQENISYLPIGCIDDPLLAFGGNDSAAGVMRRPARDPCDRDAVFKTRKKFAKSVKRESRELRLKRALVPWLELVRRDARSAPVQEALVAAPYVMTELGAVDQATDAYRYGIQVLEAERRRLDTLLERMAQASLPHTSINGDVPIADLNLDALLRRWQMDGRDARYYTSATLTGNQFREDIERYNRLLMLRQKLIGLAPELNAAAQEVPETTADVRRQERAAQLADRREVMLIRVGRGLDALGESLQQQMTDELTARRKQTDEYLSQARFSLARLFDNPPKKQQVRLEDIPPEPEEPGMFSLRRWIGDDSGDTREQGNALTGEAPSGKTYADRQERRLFDVRGWFTEKDTAPADADTSPAPQQPAAEEKDSSWFD